MYHLWLKVTANLQGMKCNKPVLCPMNLCVCLSSHGYAATGGLRPKGRVSRTFAHVYARERRVGYKEGCRVYSMCMCVYKHVMCVCVCVCRSPVSRSVSTLQDIPEVMDELLEKIAAESPG